jgi:membrane protease YdiL (CAAX protease family)
MFTLFVGSVSAVFYYLSKRLLNQPIRPLFTLSTICIVDAVLILMLFRGTQVLADWILVSYFGQRLLLSGLAGYVMASLVALSIANVAFQLRGISRAQFFASDSISSAILDGSIGVFTLFVFLNIARWVEVGRTFRVANFGDFFHLSPTAAVLFSAVAIVVGPFVEELMYRGVLYSALREWFRASTVIIVTSGFFAFSHDKPSLTLFCLGVTTGLVRHRTGGVFGPIWVHSWFNSAPIWVSVFWVATR